jgi:hypothetical protein
VQDYQFAKEALAPWYNRSEPVEPRVVPDAICAILSVPNMPAVSEEESEVFGMLQSIMKRENRKWLSISQVALPFQQMTGKVTVNEASLKSRVGLPVLDHPQEEAPAAGPGLQMQYRRRFLDLLSKCIPIEEQKRYPYLLTLVDSHVVGTLDPPSSKSTGIDAAAWCFLNRLFMALLMERGKTNQCSKITADTPLDVIEAKYAAALERLAALIDEYPALRAIDNTAPSKESLFSRLIVHAALNRHYLETQAFQERSDELIAMQVKVFTEISETAPSGLDGVLEGVSNGARIDYLGFVNAVLPRTMAEKGKTMTPSIQAAINAQADAVIASARSAHFDGEWQMNEFLAGRPQRAKAMLWILLTWCYQHGYQIRNEDPGIKKAKFPVLTTKSRLIEGSNDISTLRRMLASPVFSFQWEAPSPGRLALYARQNAAVRKLVQSKFMEKLKGASLSQWEAAARQILPWDGYCSELEHAEVGTLMKEFGVFERLPLPLY